MKKVQNILLVLALFVFLNQTYVSADDSPPSLPTYPPPLPIANNATVRTVSPGSTASKAIVVVANNQSTEEDSLQNQEENIFLLESVLFYLNGTKDYVRAIDPMVVRQEYENPKLYEALTALDEFNQGKRNDIGKFLKTNYRTEYLTSEMYDKENSHLAKPIYMSEVVRWSYDAVAANDLNTVRVLLDNYGFLLTIKNNEGYGLLSYSILHERNDIAYMLVYRGANLTEENKYKAQPLNIAARTNNIEAVKLLLDNGCDAEYSDSFGKSALDYALMNNNKEMHNYLLSYKRA